MYHKPVERGNGKEGTEELAAAVMWRLLVLLCFHHCCESVWYLKFRVSTSV